MLLYYDLDRAKWVTTPGFSSGPEKPVFIRRDTASITVKFCRGATIVVAGTSPTFKFGIKRLNAFTADFLVYTATVTVTGSGSSSAYTFEPSLNTEELDAVFASNPPSADCALEVEITDGATITSTTALPVTIANDYIRGDEGTSTPAGPTYPAPGQLIVWRSDLVGFTGGGSTKLDGLTTTTLTAGYLVALVKTSEGVESHWRLDAGTTAESEAGGIVRPDDYHASTNAKIWTRIF